MTVITVSMEHWHKYSNFPPKNTKTELILWFRFVSIAGKQALFLSEVWNAARNVEK